MASIIASGDYWRLEDDGTLYIYCVGDMPNYTSSTIPWYDYRTQITSAAIADGVSSIGDSAFSGCSGLTSVTIPSGVTSIGNYAFYNCSGLTSVTIPSSVTSIGQSAFYNCSGLTSVTIPSGVTSIGNYAFFGCSGLTSVTIPSSVTSIGEGAFSKCVELLLIQVDSENRTFSSENGVLFNKDLTTLICYPTGKTDSSYKIPNSATSIGQSAFYNCSGLTSVTIPDSVTSIGNYAFSGCSGLTSATIPSGVTNIGGYTFRGCSGLTSIAIPDSVTSIGQSAFSNCNALTDVYYGGTETQWNAITVGGNNTPLTSATIHYNTCIVTFNANGGTGNMSAQTFTARTVQKLTANAFTRTGYTFGGWNTAADGSGTAYADGASYTANADITLYAQWTQVVLSSIAVTTPPAKTAYTVGETFDPSGMVVTATYSDGTTAIVSGYSASPSGELTVSDMTITVSYTENSVTATATVNITVTEPEPVPTANRITIQVAKRNGDTLTFSGHEAKQVEYVQSTSFDGNDVQADEMSAIIRQTAPDWLSNWNGVNMQSPVLLAYGLRTEKYYHKIIRRVGKYDFELTAQSPLGRLTDDFPGGLYSAASLSDVIKAVIGDAIPVSAYSVNPLLDKVKVYGWIPYQERRTTLHQLALAYGFLIRRDENHNLYFTVPDTGDPYEIPDNVIFTGGSVDYSVGRTYYRADITAYEYLRRETEPQILYEGGTFAENFTVRFDTPMFDLQADNLTISDSGVNYAVVSGSGQLTGKPYTQISSTVSIDGDRDADPQHILTVSNIPMITSLNAASVGERLIAYHNAPAVVNMDILRTTQRSGDYVTFTDPFGDAQRGYIIALSGSITSIDRATASIVCEYAPSWDSDYDAVQVLTGSDDWPVPEYLDGKRIRVVLIGGGTCGEDGQDGTESEGGRGGAPGAGGKIWDSEVAMLEKLIVNYGEKFSYSCGTGGVFSGEAGTETTFRNDSRNINFSSENGTISNSGFYDGIEETLYALPGTYRGVDGGAATTGTENGDRTNPGYNNVQRHTVTLPWDSSRSWTSGTPGDGDAKRSAGGDGYIYDWAYGGLGGGAAVGGSYDGSNARCDGYNSIGGDGGNGADAYEIFPDITYGCGGNGGHGGGAGGAGGKGHSEATGGNDPSETSDGSHGRGGYGCSGQNGADGCILIYYNRPDT